MTWQFKQKLDAYITKCPKDAAAANIAPEVERLGKQRCGYCSGFGHSGNDCPTDAKLLQLRIGVREQAQLVQYLRKECRIAANMKGITGFSLLSAHPSKKRTRA